MTLKQWQRYMYIRFYFYDHNNNNITLQLEEELRSISEQVKQCTPIVHVIASKVKHLLSQS